MRRAAIPLFVLALLACTKEEAPPPAAQGPAEGSLEWKIDLARSAAPAGISQGAQVLELSMSDTAGPTELAPGTTGWSCIVDIPETPAPDPVCADSIFMGWVRAEQAHETPVIRAMGVAYMLRGGQGASDTDPFKTAPDSGQPWLIDPPHIMVVMPDPGTSFAGLPTTRTTEGPYVMYAGTPYAHLMVPAQGTRP